MTNWPKIRVLEARLRWHQHQAAELHRHLGIWKRKGDVAHSRLDAHGIAEARAFISFFKAKLAPEEAEIHRLQVALAALRPKAQLFEMGGWVAPGVPARMQRQDQGQDFEIPLFHHVVAPGHGRCVGYGSDRPFPNGFGSPYALVEIYDGRFGGNSWYLGHANEPIIRPGEHFSPGRPLARLNHSLNSGWGWIELGHLPYGSMAEGSRWHHLFTPVWKAYGAVS